jgi:hypothetical protein
MSEWQPIETAPKDGSTVLIFIPKSRISEEEVHLARWGSLKRDVEHDEGNGLYRKTKVAYMEGWFSSMLMFGPCAPPTHWMPIPSKPS